MHDYWTACTFDPLLTHSKSYNGQVIQATKESDEFKSNADFPLNYIGNFDSESDGLTWSTLQERERCHRSGNYYGELRDLFGKHFDPRNDAVD